MPLNSPHFRNSPRLVKALENNPTLSNGESGHAVRLVQQAMIDLKYSMPISTKKFGSPDGIFGSETKNVVRDFQRDCKGLTHDGIVGTNTLTRLDAMLVDQKIRFKPLPALPPGSPGASGSDPDTPDRPKPGVIHRPPTVPHKIERYLQIDAQTARRLAPATIEPFDGLSEWPVEKIRCYLAASLRVARLTKLTLHTLAANKRREDLWNTGFERWWFGDFSERKLNKVSGTFDSIALHLASASLRVIGDIHKTGYASALPGIRKITLGMLWVNPSFINPNKTSASECDKKAERVQTFIHEAAHIAGRTNGLSESNNYGRTLAHALAGRGMRATRSADNFGYYAIDIATEGQHRRLS